MASLNKVLLMGNLTRDPEMRYTPNGLPVVDLGLAINRVYYAGEGRERKEETTFVDLTFFGKQAETAGKYLKKGRPIFVEGRLKFDSWTAQDGGKRSKLSVVVERFQFLGARPEGGPGPGPGAPPQSSAAGETPEAEDDIPF